jgi:hypothetical protein
MNSVEGLDLAEMVTMGQRSARNGLGDHLGFAAFGDLGASKPLPRRAVWVQ